MSRALLPRHPNHPHPKQRQRTHETASLCVEPTRRATRIPTSPSHPPRTPHLDPLSLLAELAAVKSEYTHLKDCYGVLLREKEQTARENTERQAAYAEAQAYRAEAQQWEREAEKWRKAAGAAEADAARIKKECYRMVENERLRTRKLEELLQEKELMISYLRKSKGNETTVPSANQSALSFLHPERRLTPRDSLLSNVVLEEHDHSSMEPSHQIDARKDLVILHSSSNSSPSQCPTFEQRHEEDLPAVVASHVPPRPIKSQLKLKPTKGSRSQSKKLLIVTDQNQGPGRYGNSSVSSRQKKSTKRSKV